MPGSGYDPAAIAVERYKAKMEAKMAAKKTKAAAVPVQSAPSE